MSRDRSVAVGLEIAGGQTTVALVDLQGHIRHRCQAKTLRGRPAVATLEPYLRAVDILLSQARDERLRVRGLSVSIPGSLDYTCRCPKIIPVLPALNGFPLCDVLEARYQLPARLYVDVDAAALGEYHFGAGKGLSRLLFLTVNTVVGASLLIDGQCETTPQSYTGHVCHLSLSQSNGVRCSCGKRGCINTLLSYDALQKTVSRILRRGEESSFTKRLLLNRESFSPQLLAEEASRGDSVALQIYSELGRWLNAAIIQYVDLFTPNKLILGGGLLYANELLLSQVRSIPPPKSSSRVCSLVEVIPACLGRDAGLLGAAVSML